MPVIIYVPPGVPDLVIQGEQMRNFALYSGIFCAPAPPELTQLIEGSVDPAIMYTEVMPGEHNYLMNIGSYPVPSVEILCANFFSLDLVCTPCGANVPTAMDCTIIDSCLEASAQWQIIGTTVDASGNALGNCRVVVMETGRINQTGTPVVNEGLSNGSGNYTITVPYYTSYQVFAYLPGSPDVVGSTVNVVTPTSPG